MREGYWLVILVALGLFLSLPCACAAGIAPGKVEITFDASANQTLTFYAVNSGQQTINAKLFATGDLAQYVQFNQTEIVLEPNTFKPFQVTLVLPPDLPQGIYHIGIDVMEAASSSSEGLAATTAAESRIEINNEYKSGVINVRMTANNVEMPGQIVNFAVNLTNPTSFNLSDMSGSVTVYDLSNNTIKNLPVEKLSILAASKKQLKVQWGTSGASIGKYKAIASFNYGGNSSQAETYFYVGKPVVEILNLTASQQGEFTKLKATVQNKWNENFNDVYALFNILEGDSSIGVVQSPATNISSGQTAELVAYWNGVYDSAKYDVDITVHFGELTNQKKLSIIAESPPVSGKVTTFAEGGGNADIYMIAGVLVLIMVVLIALFFKRPRRPKVPKQPKARFYPRRQNPQYGGMYR